MDHRYEKLEIGLLRKKFFKAKNYCSKNLISIRGVEMKLRIIMKKYEVDSAIKFLKKWILRPLVITGTIRQRWSQDQVFTEKNFCQNNPALFIHISESRFIKRRDRSKYRDHFSVRNNFVKFIWGPQMLSYNICVFLHFFYKFCLKGLMLRFQMSSFFSLLTHWLRGWNTFVPPVS